MRVSRHATPPNASQPKPTVSVRRLHVALGRIGARWALFTPKTRPNRGPRTGQRGHPSGSLSEPTSAASRRIKVQPEARLADNSETRRGYPFRLEAGERLPARAGLPHPDTLAGE